MSLVAFAFGLTELAKKLGLTGEWLTLCSVLCGALGFYLQTYHPEGWLVVSQCLVGATPAAGVSFVNRSLQAMKDGSSE